MQASWLTRGSGQIAPNQFLHQLVTIQLADHAAGIVIVGDIGGVLGQQVAHDLIDGVIALFLQSVEDGTKGTAHILFVITGNGKLNGIFRHGFDLLMGIGYIIAHIFEYVKGKYGKISRDAKKEENRLFFLDRQMFFCIFKLG